MKHPPPKKKNHLVSKDIMSNQFIILLMIKYPRLYSDTEKVPKYCFEEKGKKIPCVPESC